MIDRGEIGVWGFRMFPVFLFWVSIFAAGLCCAAGFASTGGLDAGGGRSLAGAYATVGSLGAPFAAAEGTAGVYRVYVGLAEVVYGGLAVAPEADSDGNGLVDAWELANFGMIGVEGAADADGDGTSNAMEQLALTDPNDPMDVFRPRIYRDASGLILEVATRAGRVYTIWGSPDMETWTVRDAVVGDDSVVEWEYPLSEAATQPYFLKVEIGVP